MSESSNINLLELRDIKNELAKTQGTLDGYKICVDEFAKHRDQLKEVIAKNNVVMNDIRMCIHLGLPLSICDGCQVVIPAHTSHQNCVGSTHESLTHCEDCHPKDGRFCSECSDAICDQCDTSYDHMCGACRNDRCNREHQDRTVKCKYCKPRDAAPEDSDSDSDEDDRSDSEIYCEEEHLPESGQCQYCQPDGDGSEEEEEE